MKKIIITSFLSLLIIISYLPLSSLKASPSIKISPVFYESMQNSSQVIRVIVKFRDLCQIDYSHESINVNNRPSPQDYLSYLKRKQEEWIKNAKTRFPFTVRHAFIQTYNGISLQIRGYNIRYLLQDPYIEKITDVSTPFKVQRHIVAKTLSAQKAWTMLDRNQVKLTGKGVRVGVLDSGIDYYHPDFLDSSGKPSRIKGGKDFGDKDDNYYDYGGTFKPGFFPHGTAVAGVIAGNNLKDPLRKGMAPDSDLLIYKIYSDKDGSGNGDEIMASIEQAITDRCHVLNLSLGNAYPAKSIDPENPLYMSISQATKAGILFVCAAGNQGSRSNNGDYTIIVPGIYEPTLSVAGTDDRMNIILPFVYPDQTIQKISCNKMAFTPPFPIGTEDIGLVDCGFGGVGDFRKVDVKGKIALVSRGPKIKAISLKEKNLNAKNAGAIGVITYNYEEEPLRGYLLEGYDKPHELKLLPNAELSGINGTIIKAALSQGATLKLPQEHVVTLYDKSSAGPCLSGDEGIFKPDVCAPARQISSCIMSTNQNKVKIEYPYGESDGTSLACPAASGVIALIKQAHPEFTPLDLKAIIMNSADIIKNPFSGIPFSYINQGSGQINAVETLLAPAITYPPYLMKTISTPKEDYFEIRNITEQPITTKLSFEVFGELGDLPLITAIFSDNELTIPAGTKKKFSVTLSYNKESLKNKRYEGAIWIQTNQSRQHIPVILTNGRITDNEKTITNIALTSSDIDIKGETKTIISFQVNAGNRFLTTGTSNIYDWRDNCFETFSLSVFDTSQNQWGTIFYAENMFVGSYHISWNGKDIYGKEFLPNGGYLIRSEMNGIKYNMEYGQVKSIESMPEIVDIKPIRILNSSLPSLPILLVASADKIKVGTEFVLDILLADSKEIEEIDFTLTFSKASTSVISYSLGEFVDRKRLNPSKDVTLEEGIFSMHATRDPTKKKVRLSVASIRLKADNLTPKTGLILGISLNKEESSKPSQRIRIEYPLILLQRADFRYGDFNMTNDVDEFDWLLLQEEYGKTYTDPDWKAVFDLNNNWLIDLTDIAIFSRHYNKVVTTD